MSFKIQIYNNISNKGLDNFNPEIYCLTHKEIITDPDAILLRSQKLSLDMIPKSTLAIARAGSGVNNVPVSALTEHGVPVFNTPGANANAVKELVLAGLFLSARNICSAWQYVENLKKQSSDICNQDDLNKEVELAKKQFKGMELPGKVLAVIGLGSIGVKVANAAHSLGMTVIGYDPAITVERAWELSADVQKAKTLVSAVKEADFVSVHVPLLDSTRNMIDRNILNILKPTAVLLNFARNQIVDEEEVNAYLYNNKLACYVTDFPSKLLQENNKVIALPHIGASTQEAEELCAVLAVDTLSKYLQTGIIQNSVNFPEVLFTEEYKHRLTVVNQNIPKMVAQMTAILAEDQLNIVDLINKSRDNIAYTIIDLDQEPNNNLINSISNIAGVLAVRYIRNNNS